MPIFTNTAHPEFSNLNELVSIINDPAIVVIFGKSTDEHGNPANHVILSSVNSNTNFDFIQKDANTYELQIRKKQGKKIKEEVFSN